MFHGIQHSPFKVVAREFESQAFIIVGMKRFNLFRQDCFILLVTFEVHSAVVNFLAD